ncbi:hypothetical protein ACOKFD_06905 [Flagellimonas sp. S174]|uniref:hypothetical protein n=1 Tax=Flagellimonas sp. S174 TaxID=3410790 RepID=UPI003BF4C4A9
MKTIQKTIFLAVFVLGAHGSIQAQSVDGALTLNGKSKVQLELETNSVTALFKDFKAKKYEMYFQFEADEIPENSYGETLVFFDFITQVKKDGKVMKEVKREAPFNYFAGDMFLAPETFDFIPILSELAGNDVKNPKHSGILPEGEYRIALQAVPKGCKGAIDPLDIYFVLRRRPTR